MGGERYIYTKSICTSR